jgi:hypothetical protein
MLVHTRRHYPNCKAGILADKEKPEAGFCIRSMQLRNASLPIRYTSGNHPTDG